MRDAYTQPQIVRLSGRDIFEAIGPAVANASGGGGGGGRNSGPSADLSGFVSGGQISD